MNIIRKSILLLVACVACLAASAQGDPIVKKYVFADHSYVSRMSDNGLWAVTGAGSQDIICTPKIIDLNSGKEISIGSATNDEVTCDITNDGSIVVGSAQNVPAYWSKADGKWHALELKSSQANHQVPGKIIGGIAMSVTPDGKYAVGCVDAGDDYAFAPALWDLSTGKTIMTDNLPVKDMAHIDQKQMRFDAISADGRYICATMSPSYLPGTTTGDSEADLGGNFTFVYDTQTHTYNVVGFTESDTHRWKSDYDGCFLIDGANMSNNGRFVAGACRIYRETDATTDYYVPYVYDVEKDLFTVYENEYTKSNSAYAVSNEGLPLMGSPEGSPYRNWYIYDGSRFWYAAQDVLNQRWGTDLMGQNGYDNTGTADNISDNGMRIIATPTYLDGDSYVLDLPVPLSELINEDVNMLGSWTASPAVGSQVSHLTKMNVTFTQKIKFVGTGNVVTLEDENDNVIATATKNQADGDNKVLNITFRKAKAKLEAGKDYYVHIPAGAIAMSDALDKTNQDIYINVVGRNDAPVKCTKIVPAEGTAVAKVDVNTNPITLDFDTDIDINPNETRKAHIYRNDETEPYAELNFYYGRNQVALAPSTTVNLYKENTYRVVVPAGIITDACGNGGNEEMTFTYQGAYERTVSYDDANIFKNDFDSRDIVNAFMLYDGDQNVPATKPKEWSFNYSLPWYFVRTSNATQDYAAASHSMYAPAGKSEDWMVVPQLYIPDASCELSFGSQSYLNSKDDYLKVYIWANDNIYNALNKDIVSRIKAEGDLVYNKLQDPGATEEGLEGEWMENTISLEKYAGKNIYIAFYNDNEDQSAIFINDVYVKHNMPVLISFDTEESVVNKESVNISGSIAGNMEDKTITDITLTLVDTDGKTIDTKALTGMKLSKGTYTKFAFDKPLPLKAGVTNKFKVLMDVDGTQTEITKSINHLLFQPVKRVVLEEFTGRDCSNCPLGIVTIDNLRKRFGDKFLPIAIHGYTGDPLGNGLEAYYGYLELNAAPSARINRSDSIISPMVSDGSGNYYMSVKSLEAATGQTTYPLWSDYVESEMNKSAISEITAEIAYDEASKTFSVPASVRYAMNAENQNLNIFAVLVEQEVPVIYQQNGFSSITSDILLPWSAGGDKASAYVMNFNYDDVCRATWGSTFLGNGGLLPSNLVAGTEYKVSDIKITLSDRGDINPAHCQAIVMMFDANTGKYINAVRTARVDGKTDTAIDGIIAGEAASADNAWYTISGAKMNAIPSAAGVYIHQGKKFVIK